jgi:hypothetical protein
MPVPVAVVAGEAIARYGFGNGHPFGSDRHECFVRELAAQGIAGEVLHYPPRSATAEELVSFHTKAYVDFVQQKSATGEGFLDGGDTPAFKGVFDAASSVVGATLVAVEALMAGACRRAFVPIAGLHHAGRDHAAGFCVFNDCGVAVERLRTLYGLRRIAYVDIDAHHGDGVYYAFDDDPELIFADIHEDGRDLYPGTGAAEETGRGTATGTKLNVPLPPGAGRTWSGSRANSSCSSAARTAWPVIRSPTCASARRRTPMRRTAWVSSRTARVTAGCWAWEAGATIAVIWRGHGPGWCGRFCAENPERPALRTRECHPRAARRGGADRLD